MKTSIIDYNLRRGGYFFVTKEHGDCLYHDTIEQAMRGVYESWGMDTTIYFTGRARNTLCKQEQAVQVAS